MVIETEMTCEICETDAFRKLHDACLKGDLCAIKNSRDKENFEEMLSHQQYCAGDHPWTTTPFDEAAWHGHVDVVDYLLAHFQIELHTSVTHHGQSIVDLLLGRASSQNDDSTSVWKILKILLSNFPETISEQWNDDENDLEQNGWFDLVKNSFRNKEIRTLDLVMQHKINMSESVKSSLEEYCEEQKEYTEDSEHEKTFLQKIKKRIGDVIII